VKLVLSGGPDRGAARGRHRQRGDLLGRARRRGRARRAGARSFSFLSVPAAEPRRVIDALDGREMRGQALSLERVG